MINENPLDVLAATNAEFALDLEYQKEIVNDDVIDNRLEVAETDVLDKKETLSEINEAKAILAGIDPDEELRCESVELNRLKEFAKRNEDASFADITKLI